VLISSCGLLSASGPASTEAFNCLRVNLLGTACQRHAAARNPTPPMRDSDRAPLIGARVSRHASLSPNEDDGGGFLSGIRRDASVAV
jgi:hypothetical protein